MTVVAMCSAGIALFVIGVWAQKHEIAAAHGLDKIVALSNLCCAVPLAVFGALHLFGPQFVIALVPRYMPWRLFWVYFVGCALIAASLSIATKIAVRWSGLLFGIMMFLFVAMIHLPGALARPHDLDIGAGRIGVRSVRGAQARQKSLDGHSFALGVLCEELDRPTTMPRFGRAAPKEGRGRAHTPLLASGA